MHLIRNLILLVVLASVASQATHATEINNPLSLEEARHLLSRTGFGASAHELDRLTGQPRQDAIDRIISGLAIAPSTRPPSWVQQPAPHHWARNQLGKTERREFIEAREREVDELRLWWISEMIQTPSPQTERLVLFWHNHFATAISGINDQAISIARQHMMLRELGSGNLRTLLKAIIRDPAMLNYLDNDNSRKQAPNENLARELMELFTLGEGNYTETDIKNAARALTGYSKAPAGNLQFRFKPNVHDNKKKTIFSQHGNFNGDDVIDLILTQPATAEFIARKFWKVLVTEQPPSTHAIRTVANKFRNSDYDIKTLYAAILQSDEFWDPHNRASIVKSPVDLTVGTIRSTGIVPQTWQLLPAVTDQLGQELFDPPNVAGWPGGQAWVTPGRLLNRLEWLRSLQDTCDGSSCQPSMRSMNAMSMQANSNSNTTTEVPATSMPANLVLRMSSEEFDGPVQYKVTLLLGDMIVWSSGETPLYGGFDTNRFGRVTNPKQLPWQNISFSLPKSAEKFNTIEIEYLNDLSKPGRERNLYIDWVSFKDKFFNSDDGRQTNHCKNRKRSRGGTLLCNGKLRLTKPSASTPATPGPTNQNQLSASGVYIWGVQNTNQTKSGKGSAALMYTLVDAALGDRQWHSLTVQYRYKKSTGKYSLRFNSYECWPDCFEQWPPCSRTSKDESRTRSVDIPMSPADNTKCPLTELAVSDQHLLNSLWKNLPVIYELGKSNRKLDRTKVKQAYDSWSPHIEKITRFQSTTRDHVSVAEFSLRNDSSTQPDLKNAAIYTAPLAAGRTAKQTLTDQRRLLAGNADITLGALLLPGTSANQQSNSSLQDVLSNLAFQLK